MGCLYAMLGGYVPPTVPLAESFNGCGSWGGTINVVWLLVPSVLQVHFIRLLICCKKINVYLRFPSNCLHQLSEARRHRGMSGWCVPLFLAFWNFLHGYGHGLTSTSRQLLNESRGLPVGLSSPLWVSLLDLRLKNPLIVTSSIPIGLVR